MRLSLLFPLLVLAVLAGCQSPTSTETKTLPAALPRAGTITFQNGSTTGLTLSAYDAADTAVKPQPVATAPLVPAGQTALITAIPADRDIRFRVLDDRPAGINTDYSLVSGGVPKVFRLSPLRAYTLEFSVDATATPPLVWNWELAANPLYEVSELKVTPGTNSLTLTWKDPVLADLVSVQVTPQYGTTQTVAKGTQTVTLGALPSGVSQKVTVTALYPEIASRGTAQTAIPLAGIPSATLTAYSLSPSAGAVSAPVYPGVVSATFSADLDPSTVTAGTFLLNAGEISVPGTISVNAATVTFTPLAALTVGTVYTATLTVDIKSLAGGRLTADKSWSFTTEPTADPRVLSQYPRPGATGASIIDQDVSVTFDRKIDPASVTSTSFFVTGPQGNLAGSLSVTGSYATFHPSGLLTPGSTYTVTLTSGIKSAGGAAFNGTSISTFNTVAPVPLWVSYHIPMTDAVAVSWDLETIDLQFGGAVYGPSVTAETFRVTDETGAVIPGSVRGAGTFITFTPTAPLPQGKRIQVSLTTDIMGETGGFLGAPYTWSFTMGYPPLFSAADLLGTDYMLTAGLAIGDVTGDGKADLVAVNDLKVLTRFSNTLAVYAQTGAVLGAPVLYPLAATQYGNTTSVAIGDLNGDGLNDVAVGEKDRIEVFHQNLGGTLVLVKTLSTTACYGLKVVDLNSDGLSDLAGVKSASSTVSVWFQGTTGALGTEKTFSAGHGGSDALAWGDLNADGKTDLVVMSGATTTYPNLSVLKQAGSGTFSAAVGSSLSPFSVTHGLAVGDLNGDSKADVVVSSGSGTKGTLSVFYQGTGGLTPAVKVATSEGTPKSLAIADIDRDGLMDLVCLFPADGQICVYLQRPDRTFAPERITPLWVSSPLYNDLLAVGDLNSDGKVDLAAVEDSGVGVFYGR